MSKPLIYIESEFTIQLTGRYCPALPRCIHYEGEQYLLTTRFFQLRVELSYKHVQDGYGLHLTEVPQPEVATVCVEAETILKAAKAMKKMLKDLSRWNTPVESKA